MTKDDTKNNMPTKTVKKRHPVSGSKNDDFTNILANQAVSTIWHTNKNDKAANEMQQSATLGAMKGMQPQDEIEGMLVAQMIAMHNASMECLRRAMIPEQSFEGRGQNLNSANKLSRSYAALLDSLTRYRGKGVSEQKVTVQHVHVAEGGQAIVGNVER